MILLGRVFDENRSERLFRTFGVTFEVGACLVLTDIRPSSKFLELLGAAELSPARVSDRTKLDDDISFKFLRLKPPKGHY